MKSLFKAVILRIIFSLTIVTILPCISLAQDNVIHITSSGELNPITVSGTQYLNGGFIGESSPIEKVTVTASYGLNVRTGPGTNNAVIRVLPLGTTVEVLEEKNGWYRIDNIGWISSYYTKIFQAESKIAYLTFDDGPSSNNTRRILDILKKYNIKATFFVNGYGKKDLYKRIVYEGHVIGNHTYSHDYKTIYSSIDSFKKDVEKLNDYLEQVTGIRPDILRFPGGSNNTVSRKYGGRKIMKELCSIVSNDMEYQYFDWNVSSEDATTYRASKDFILRSALKGAKYTDQAIILMHDSAPKTTTADVLPEIIEGLTDMGFKFDVLTKDTPSIQFIKP